jgi:hypothetical protein
MSKKIVFERVYSEDSLCDIERDVLEAIQPDYNPKMEGVYEGKFKVTIEWEGDDDS